MMGNIQSRTEVISSQLLFIINKGENCLTGPSLAFSASSLIYALGDESLTFQLTEYVSGCDFIAI
jgi:hypothetical protein